MAIIDVNNPGLTEVENQAYPRPLQPPQAIPIPSSFVVAGQAAGLPSLSLGVPVVAAPDIDVADQSLVNPLRTVEVVVTESGNYETNNQSVDLQNFTISAVAVIDSGLPTQSYQLQLGVANLTQFGLDIAGLFAYFPGPASAPENKPSRVITAWSAPNVIVVSNLDALGNAFVTPPQVNDTIQIGIVRQGSASVYDLTPAPVDVVVGSSYVPNARTVNQ